MDRFETVLNFALDAKGATAEDTKAEILKAADKLLEDSATEMAEDGINAICGILLYIYKTGNYPGKATNPLMDELQKIVAEAGRQHAADNTAEDSY